MMKLLSLFFSLCLAAVALAAPPVNDPFANATPIAVNATTGYKGTLTGTNVGATFENPGEANLPHASKTTLNTVWFRYDATEEGYFAADLVGSNFPALVEIYEGTTLANCDVRYRGTATNSNGTMRITYAEMHRGFSYYIVVWGQDDANSQPTSGSIAMSYELQPKNAYFSDRVVLNDVSANTSDRDVSGSIRQNTFNAFKEPGEPNHAGQTGGHSVWFQWYAYTEDEVTFVTFGSDFDTMLAVYENDTGGGFGANFVPVISNDNAGGVYGNSSKVTFTPNLNGSASKSYYIAVDGASTNAQGHLLLNYAQKDGAGEYPAGVFVWKVQEPQVNESTGSATVTVYRVQGSTGAVAVNYATSAGVNSDTTLNASAPGDFTTKSGTLSFAAGELSKDIAVTLVNDSVPENDEGFLISLSAATNNASIDNTTTNGAKASVTIVNDDFPPNDNFANSQTLSGNSGTVNGVSNFGASAETGEPATATSRHSLWYRITPAQSGVLQFTVGDPANFLSHPAVRVYTGPAVASLTGVAGAELVLTGANSSTTTFRATSGTTYFLQFDSADSNQTGGANISYSFITPGTLALSAATFNVAENVGSGQLAVTVTRSSGTQGAVSVQYATSVNGSDSRPATSGADFGSASGTLSFANGESSKNIVINITNDAEAEGDETFHITLSAPTGFANLATSSATVTIVDDEHPGVFAFSSATANIAENSGPLVLTVNRTNGSDGTAVINYTTANLSAKAGLDFGTSGNAANVAGTVTFAPGETSKTVSIPVINDLVFELSEAFSVSLTSASIGAIGNIPSVVVTLTSDDLFFPSAGSHAVLIGSGDAIAREGLLEFKTTTKSAVTGKVQLGGKSFSFKGAVDGQGLITATAPRGKTATALQVSIQLDDGGDIASATVSDPTNGATFSVTGNGGRAVYSSKNPVAPALVGPYTFLLEDPVGAGQVPGGIGFGSGTIGKTGGVAFVGKTGDGTPFTIGAKLNKRGTFPVNVRLYKNNGYFAGDVDVSANGLAATMTWQKAAGIAKEVRYTGGFNLDVALTGLKWIAPAKRPPTFLLSGLTASNGIADVDWSGSFAFSQTVTLTTANKLTPLSVNPAKVRLKFTPATGLWGGSFTPPGGKAVKFFGALLQGGAGRGGAVYTTATDAGAAEFAPQ